VSIFSSLDSQSLVLTRKLLEGYAPNLTDALPKDNYSRYPVDEVTVELDTKTVNQIIEKITFIGNCWLEDTDNENFSERQQIIAYLLKQWISVGEDIARLDHEENQSLDKLAPNTNHRIH